MPDKSYGANSGSNFVHEMEYFVGGAKDSRGVRTRRAAISNKGSRGTWKRFMSCIQFTDARVFGHPPGTASPGLFAQFEDYLLMER